MMNTNVIMVKIRYIITFHSIVAAKERFFIRLYSFVEATDRSRLLSDNIKAQIMSLVDTKSREAYLSPLESPLGQTIAICAITQAPKLLKGSNNY